nr:MAG TPA: hypothetical protein [Caudoviricetes sp.]
MHFWQRKSTHRRYYNGIRINIYCWRYGRGVSYMLNAGKTIKRNEPDYPVTATKK